MVVGPEFLAYSRPLDQADCVLVMLGGDGARMKQGKYLLEQGRAEALLLPAHLRMLQAGEAGLGRWQATPGFSAVDQWVTVFGRSVRVVEDSHAELITGKRMMDKLGYQSVIIVSSPQHMLRLRLIAWQVFENGEYRVGLEPAKTDVESQTSDVGKKWEKLEMALAEYAKIGWFLIYSGFVCEEAWGIGHGA